MAIDSAEKRKAISGIMIPHLIPGVTINSSKDQEWRQEAGWSYSGIEAAEPASSGISRVYTYTHYIKQQESDAVYITQSKGWTSYIVQSQTYDDYI